MYRLDDEYLVTLFGSLGLEAPFNLRISGQDVGLIRLDTGYSAGLSVVRVVRACVVTV